MVLICQIAVLKLCDKLEHLRYRNYSMVFDIFLCKENWKAQFFFKN